MCPQTLDFGRLNQNAFSRAWNSIQSTGVAQNVEFAAGRDAVTIVAIDPTQTIQTTVGDGVQRYSPVIGDSGNIEYHVDCAPGNNRCLLYPNNLPPVVLVMGVTSTTATFGFRTDFEADTVRVLYSTEPNELVSTSTQASITTTTTTRAQDDCTGSLSVNSLQPDIVYYYRLEVDGTLCHVDPFGIRTQRFRTFPLDTPDASFSFSVFADSANYVSTNTVDTYLHGGLSPEDNDDDSRNPLFAVQIGDFDHSDPETLDEYRTMHQGLRSPFYQQGRRFVDYVASQLSFFHVWDDHDYCGNDSDGTCTRKAIARQAFDEYYRGQQYVTPDQGIWFTFEAGSAVFFVLDTRSQRSPDIDPDTPLKSILGETQKAWLKNALLTDNHQWKFVISTISANVDARPNNVDHWGSFQNEADEMRNFLQQHGLNGGSVIMISGDLHTGGAIDNGCNNRWGIPELGVAHTNLRGGNEGNIGTWSEGAEPGSPGFATVTVTTESVLLEAKGSNGVVLYSWHIHADEWAVPCNPQPIAPSLASRSLSPVSAPPSTQMPSLSVQPSSAPSSSGPTFCFSGHTTVWVKGKGTVYMEDLVIGDAVLTSKSTFEAVYSFGHYHKSMPGSFLQIHYETPSGFISVLEISRDHLVFVNEKVHSVPASFLQDGDHMVWAGEGGFHDTKAKHFKSSEENISSVVVVDIQSVVRRGVYAPFTPSGQIVVNGGVLASTFVSFQDSNVLKIGGRTTGLTYQWLARTFEAPHRWVCSVAWQWCKEEKYTLHGISWWVYIQWTVTNECIIPLLNRPGIMCFVCGLILVLVLLVVAKLLTTGIFCWPLSHTPNIPSLV